MDFANKCYKVFADTTSLYHLYDDVDAIVANPYPADTITPSSQRTGSMPCSGTLRI